MFDDSWIVEQILQDGYTGISFIKLPRKEGSVYANCSTLQWYSAARDSKSSIINAEIPKWKLTDNSWRKCIPCQRHSCSQVHKLFPFPNMFSVYGKVAAKIDYDLLTALIKNENKIHLGQDYFCYRNHDKRMPNDLLMFCFVQRCKSFVLNIPACFVKVM